MNPTDPIDGLKITTEEAGLIAVVRMNRSEKRTEIKKSWDIGQFRIQFHWRSKYNFWGRFGGGWNWKLGIQIGDTTAIVSLLICEIRIGKKPKEP